jgi:succinate dehydrogenase/fumarate reductase flavoprotein subunit
MSPDHTKDKEITRRQFFKGSAAGGVAGLVVGAGGAMLLGTSKPGMPSKWNYEADVVVVGIGYAGQNAAIASHDAGAKVLVLEKAPEKFAGGNSSVSGGGMRIPQKDPELVDYYRGLCFGTVPDELCTVMAEALANVPEQLKKLGIESSPRSSRAAAPAAKQPPARAAAAAPPPSGLNLLPGARKASLYSIVPGKENTGPNGSGYQLYVALKKCMSDRKIDVLYETPAKRLIQDPETREIVGVIAEEKGNKIYVKARKAVVLACGGYSNNPEMKSYFNYPAIKIYPWGSPYNTGDGLKMVSEIGAPLWHTFSIEWAGYSVKAPSEQTGVSVQASFGGRGTGGYVLVNKYGKRFMNEMKNMVHIKESLELTYFSHEQLEYPNQPFYAVFDEAVRSKQRQGSVGGMTWNSVHGLYRWSEGSTAEIEKGWVSKGDTIKDLASKMKIDPDGLQATVAKYNQYCRGKKDLDFNRPDNSLSPLSTPPYYGVELAMTCINTQGGPKHNTKAQTLDKDDKPIPRLYTPGEFGSFFGFLYPGGSNIPEAIAFGRIAGENAAAEKPWA